MIAPKQNVLIVDDDAVIRDLLSHRLRAEGYTCIVADRGLTALEYLKDESCQIMLADIRMPGMDGIELLERAKHLYPDMEVIMVTGVTDAAEAIKAMKWGAFDYVMKPFDLEYVVLDVQRALENRELHVQNRAYRQNLEGRVRTATVELREKNRQIEALLFNTITSFVNVLEAKDKYTEGHSRRVSERAALVARGCSLNAGEVEDIRLAGLLHDIGKVGIREKTLNKPERLTASEYDEVKAHPLIAERILLPIKELRKIVPNVKHHHERYDGGGYPSGLEGRNIPFGARILAVVDAYDAITSERPYRSAFSHDHALDEIERNIGKQFDPFVARTFLFLYATPEQVKVEISV